MNTKTEILLVNGKLGELWINIPEKRSNHKVKYAAAFFTVEPLLLNIQENILTCKFFIQLPFSILHTNLVRNFLIILKEVVGIQCKHFSEVSNLTTYTNKI
jgi:hypothetical protein